MRNHQDDTGANEDAQNTEERASAIDPIGFLVVTRKPGEGIAIGENTHVIVNQIRGNQVRLAVYAPKSVSIVRSSMAARRKGR